jgi:hypothetical protein
MRQCQLRGRIVHDHDVAHSRSSGSAAGRIAFHDSDLHSSVRQLTRACAPSDAGTHNHDVERVSQKWIPS